MKNKNKEQIKRKQREKKEAVKLHKSVKTTLDWLDIADVKDNVLQLRNGEMIIGVKVHPRNIFIDTKGVQQQVVNNLRITMNKLKFPIYWGFVFTPVELTEHISQLLIQLEQEEDFVIKQMIQNDLDKASWFSENFRELEFFLMIKDKDSAALVKKFDMLVGEFRNSGFSVRELGDNDYYDYLAYLFENETINNFYFSRGVFKCLQEENYIPNAVKEYAAEFNFSDLEVD